MAKRDESCYGYGRVVYPHRILRTLLVACAALMTWVVATPAWASAPGAALCDDRGASAIAPPPTLEALDDAIRQTLADSCGADDTSLSASVVPARTASSHASHSADPALACRAAAEVFLVSVPIAPTPAPQGDPRNVSFELDHPPD